MNYKQQLIDTYSDLAKNCDEMVILIHENFIDDEKLKKEHAFVVSIGPGFSFGFQVGDVIRPGFDAEKLYSYISFNRDTFEKTRVTLYSVKLSS